MSITPFLPGLPAPVPADAGAPAGGEPGDPGDLGAVFGEALTAALLATVPPPTASLPGVPATPATAPLPATAGALAAIPAAAPVVGAVLAPAGDPGRPDLPTPTATRPATPNSPGAPVAAEPTVLPGRPAAAVRAPLPEDPAPARLDARPAATDPTAASAPADPTTAPAVGSTASTAPPATAAGPRPTVERAVVQQVFPEVTRLVTSTPTDRPGTHRITLTLQPEHLGEVRVTLVVKDGAVQVRLAGAAGDPAGSAAVHRALSSGIPELQRLLERSGATEARVLVRDPFAPITAAPPAPATTSAATTGQPGPGAFTADARGDGGDGAATGDRSSGHPGQRGGRHPGAAVPEPVAVPTAGSTIPTRPTTPAGQLDRTL
ncbi:flagellar hook-length control protein FliK [Nocardioides sp. LHD-245]|uniref:flagellar hook-length control protein FliK n=1 Tax=Nocardioides sp. LHD-245 TaxID=3051387 RepID=UPI0027E08FDB|nr:flagellar hook-length control protein FliK [Nocardioides sp. LHD-245]